jgi:hypothetical protein
MEKAKGTDSDEAFKPSLNQSLSYAIEYHLRENILIIPSNPVHYKFNQLIR